MHPLGVLDYSWRDASVRMEPTYEVGMSHWQSGKSEMTRLKIYYSLLL